MKNINETTDMKIPKEYSSDLDSIIEKIIESPSEFYIKIANDLSVKEREKLKKSIKDKSCSNCTNGCCRIEHNEKIGLDEYGNPQGSSCLSWNNSKLIGKQKILTK